MTFVDNLYIQDIFPIGWKRLDIWCLWTIYLQLYFYDLATRKVNWCGAVCPNLKGMSCDNGRKTLQLKQDDIQASWWRCDLNMKGQMVHIYTDKNAPTISRRKLHRWTWQHHQAGRTDSYNMHKGYTIKRHPLANSYLTNLCPFELTNMYLLYLCALTILSN